MFAQKTVKQLYTDKSVLSLMLVQYSTVYTRVFYKVNFFVMYIIEQIQNTYH